RAAPRRAELVQAVAPFAYGRDVVTPFCELFGIDRAKPRRGFVIHPEPLVDEVARGAGDRIDADRLVAVEDVMEPVRTDQDGGIERGAVEMNRPGVGGGRELDVPPVAREFAVIDRDRDPASRLHAIDLVPQLMPGR